MKINGDDFDVPKGLAKQIGKNITFHEWGKVSLIQNSPKESKYLIERCPFPLANEDWMVVSETYILGKKLKEGDNVAIVEYPLDGRQIFDIFKESKKK
jgi:hypothetical protein